MDAQSSLKRVLVITYYYPPSGGPGVQRILKFTKYLSHFGWVPTVLTVRPEAAAYPNRDDTLMADIPDALRVVRTGAWDPYALYARLQGKTKDDAVGVGFVGESEQRLMQRVGRWLRANVFLPDARVGWVPHARCAALRCLHEAPHDALLTTGPPHSTHLVGRALKRRLKVPWVADFRDPWTGIDYYADLPMTALARHLDGRFEQNVLREADRVVVVSDRMREHLHERHPRDYEVIPNGYDPDDFGQRSPLADGFVIAYLGNMNAARNPSALWQALEGMTQVKVHLIGNVDPAVAGAVQRHGLAHRVQVLPYVDHPEAIRIMQSSALLLLVINRVPGAEGITTGKLYEYVASGRPVLGLGPPTGDAAQVLASSGAGVMFDDEDIAGVRRFIREHHEAWTAGHPLKGASPDGIEPYSRKNQTAALADLLHSIAS